MKNARIAASVTNLVGLASTCSIPPQRAFNSAWANRKAAGLRAQRPGHRSWNRLAATAAAGRGARGRTRAGTRRRTRGGDRNLYRRLVLHHLAVLLLDGLL